MIINALDYCIIQVAHDAYGWDGDRNKCNAAASRTRINTASRTERR